MICPHCGNEAGNTSFCPKCSRLVRSPLLEMHRELAAARGKTYGAEAIAAAAATRARDLAAMHASPSPKPKPSKAADAIAVTPPLPTQPPAPPSTSQLTATMRKALEKRERKAKARAAADYNDGATHVEQRSQHFESLHQGLDAPQNPSAIGAQATAAKVSTKPEPVPDRFKRPGSLTVLALLHALVGLGFLGYASVLWDGNQLLPVARETLQHYLAGGAGILLVLTSLGLLGMRPFARGLLRLFAFGGLFLVPLGTAYSIILLAYLGTKGVTLLFSHKSPQAMNASELAAVRSTQKFSPLMAVAFLVLSILPAIAVTSFVRTALPTLLDLAWGAWPGDKGATATPGPAGDVPAEPEARAEFEVRRLLEAQAVYAGLNAGLYDRIECVVQPTGCITNGDPRNAAVLLDNTFRQPERNGYVYRLVLGPRVTGPAGASSTSTDAYAYVATPVSGEGAAFCGDNTGSLVRLVPSVAAELKTPACPSPEPQ